MPFSRPYGKSTITAPVSSCSHCIGRGRLSRSMRDFRLEDHPISRVGTHLMWDAGGAVGDDDYSALDLAASFLALTPR